MEPLNLKDYAKKAKERLKNGYWTQVNEKRKHLIESASNLGKDTNRVNDEFKSKLNIELHGGTYISLENEKLYKKVCEILEKDCDTVSPISQLLDKELMISLDDRARQMYILHLSDKYKEYKAKYFQEKALTENRTQMDTQKAL